MSHSSSDKIQKNFAGERERHAKGRGGRRRVVSQLLRSVAWLALMAAGLSACAPQSIKPLEAGQLSTTLISSKRVMISAIEVVQDGSVLKISGKAKQFRHFGSLARGHVDLSVRNPDGMLLIVCSIPNSPENAFRRAETPAHFLVELPLVIDSGSSLVARYHEAPLSPISDECKSDECIGLHSEDSRCRVR